MDTITRLNEILADNNMTLYELSKASGIRYSTFGATIKRNGQLSVETIEKVCQTIGIHLYEFFMTDEDWDVFDRYCRARRDLHEHHVSHSI